MKISNIRKVKNYKEILLHFNNPAVYKAISENKEWIKKYIVMTVDASIIRDGMLSMIDFIGDNALHSISWNDLVLYLRTTHPSSDHENILIRWIERGKSGDVKVLSESGEEWVAASSSSSSRSTESILRLIHDSVIQAQIISAYSSVDTNPRAFIQSMRTVQTDFTDKGEVVGFKYKSVKDIDVPSLTSEYAGSGMKSCYPLINRCSPIGQYLNSQLIAVSALAGAGKSLFLMNESIGFIKSDKRVHYLAMGDLGPIDFITRMHSIAFQKSMMVSFHDIQAAKDRLSSEKWMDNFTYTDVPPDFLSVEEYVDRMIEDKDKFDVFIVDYDSNFASKIDSMYERGGDIYNKLAKLSRYGKLVFVASQPKNGAGKSDSFGKESLSESSKKYQIVDMVITIGSGNDIAKVGKLRIDKNRRGLLAKSSYAITNSGNFKELTPEAYYALKVSPKQISDDELAELMGMSSTAPTETKIAAKSTPAPEGLKSETTKVMKDTPVVASPKFIAPLIEEEPF